MKNKECTNNCKPETKGCQYAYYTKSFRYKGKQYKVYGKTEEEAIEKRLRLKLALEAEEVKHNTITVEKWLETALNAYKTDISDDYYYQMEHRIEKHIIPEIGNIQLQEVTPLMCQKILNNQSGMSASHIQKLKQELFFIFDSARKNGLIKNNPAADVTAPSGNKGTRRALTPKEREHFLRVAENPRYLIFKLMLFCGLRSSEAMRARYEDIVIKQGIKFLHVRGTKSAAADRLVPLPDEIPLIGEGVIARTIKGVPYNKNTYRRASEMLKREMNISMGCKVFRNQLVPPLPLADDFTPYMLRHTFCTDLKKKGVDLRHAKYLMGHSDIRITADIYDHADEESIIQAAEQMGYKRG